MPFYSITTSGGLVEAATFAALPATGATNTLYVVTATNTLYRWSGSAYTEVSASPAEVVEAANLAGFPATGAAGKIYVALDTGKTYRWGGSAYAEISAGDWATITGKPSTFAPSTHAASHGTGGADHVTPASIGAATASHGHNAEDVFVDDLGIVSFNTDNQIPGVLVSIGDAIAGKAAAVHAHAAGDITSGTIATARLASGTASAATFLRGDGQWASVISTSIDGGSAATTDGGVLDGGSATTV